jgi:outer membrane protein, heavy metal efflux system
VPGRHRPTGRSTPAFPDLAPPKLPAKAPAVNLHLAKILPVMLGVALGMPSPVLASPMAIAAPSQPSVPPAGPPASGSPRPAPGPAAPSTAPATTPSTGAAEVASGDHAAELASDRGTVSLPEVFDLLKQRSPRYKAYQADIDVAKSEVAAARVLPNPTLNLAILYLNVGFNQNGVGTYYANATLPLLIAGQRRMRVKTAKVGVKAAEADLKVNYQDLAHEARELFVELQADQAKLVVLDAALADLARLQELIAARKASGVETNYDILRIDVEALQWKTRRAEEEAEAQNTAGELGVALGLPGWAPQAEGELALLGVHGDAEQMWPDVERSQPSIVAAKRSEAFAAKNIDLVKRERWPVPTVTAGTVAIQNYYSISTQFGITVPIPMFDWGQGQIARAKAQNTRARREKEAVVASTQAELKRALRLLEHHKEVLAAFDRDVFAKLPQLKQMSEDAYRAGEAELIDLLDATRTRFEIDLQRIDLVETTAQAEVDVLAATGRIEDMTAR